MDFANEFDVGAAVDEVYAALLDVERVAPAMPGAEVLERTDDASYKVGLKVKVGPATMQWRGDLAVVEQDASDHTATLSINAREARGQGTAVAQVLLALAERAGGTHGTMSASVDLAGKAGAMEQSVIQDVSTRLVHQFAANLATMLGGAAETRAYQVVEKETENVPPTEDEDTAERDAVSLEEAAADDRAEAEPVAEAEPEPEAEAEPEPEPEPEPVAEVEPEPEPAEPDPVPAAAGAGASGAGGAAGAAADAIANAATAAVDAATEAVAEEPAAAEPAATEAPGGDEPAAAEPEPPRKPQPPAKAELDVGVLAATAAKERAPNPKLIAAVAALLLGLLLLRRARR